MKATALRMVGRLAQRVLVEGFDGWREQVAEDNRMKAKATPLNVLSVLRQCLQECDR